MRSLWRKEQPHPVNVRWMSGLASFTGILESESNCWAAISSQQVNEIGVMDIYIYGQVSSCNQCTIMQCTRGGVRFGFRSNSVSSWEGRRQG